MILVSVHDDDPLPSALGGHGMPTVFGGRPGPRRPPVSFADVDNVGGARAATKRLLHGGAGGSRRSPGPPT